MIIEPGESFQPNPFGFNVKAELELEHEPLQQIARVSQDALALVYQPSDTEVINITR